MPEIRNLPEGVLSWVQSSGTGGWATASAPASGLVGYVQGGMNFQQPRQYETVYNRGTAGHFKLVRVENGKLSFDVLYGITADYPPTAITASGVSTNQIHLEWKVTAPEIGGVQYWQFMNCVQATPKVTENERGDQASFEFQYLSHLGESVAAFSRN